MAQLVINQKFQAVGVRSASDEPSEAVLKVAELFGIGLDESYEVALYDRLQVDVRPGDIVFVTGPSGSGKSVLLARLQEAIRAAWPEAAHIVNLAAVDLPGDRNVIDLMRPPLDRALRLLSAAGLADAFLLLRTPQELSDGQRYRLRLARALEALMPQGQAPMPGDCGLRGNNSGDTAMGKAVSNPQSAIHNPQSLSFNPQSLVLVADEFCSTLDRLCARAVAYRVRRMAKTCGLTVLAASAHADLLEDLNPDVLIIKDEGDRAEVYYADPQRKGPS